MTRPTLVGLERARLTRPTRQFPGADPSLRLRKLEADHAWNPATGRRRSGIVVDDRPDTRAVADIRKRRVREVERERLRALEGRFTHDRNGDRLRGFTRSEGDRLPR